MKEKKNEFLAIAEAALGTEQQGANCLNLS